MTIQCKQKTNRYCALGLSSDQNMVGIVMLQIIIFLFVCVYGRKWGVYVCGRKWGNVVGERGWYLGGSY